MAVFARPFGRVVETQDAYRERLLRPLPRPTVKATLLILLAIAAYYWSVQGTQASPAELIDGLPNIWAFIERLFPPEFDTTTQTLQTPAISLFGLTLPRLGLSRTPQPGQS